MDISRLSILRILTSLLTHKIDRRPQRYHRQPRSCLASVSIPISRVVWRPSTRSGLAILAPTSPRLMTCGRGGSWPEIRLAQLDAGLAWRHRKYAHEQLAKDRVDYEAAER